MTLRIPESATNLRMFYENHIRRFVVHSEICNPIFLSMRRKPVVLIIEEDRYLAEIYGRRLEMEKCQVRLAGTIAEARKKIARSRPQAIILGSLKKADEVLSFVRELRQQAEYQLTPMVMLNHQAKGGAVAEAKLAGITAYFLKGQFTPEELAKQVSRLIGERTA